MEPPRVVGKHAERSQEGDGGGIYGRGIEGVLSDAERDSNHQGHYANRLHFRVVRALWNTRSSHLHIPLAHRYRNLLQPQ